MDEPTNHLDIASKNVLKDALNKFKGTMILVSHDRDFVQGLCEKIISFKEREVKTFLGDINAYLEYQKYTSIKELEKKSKEKKKVIKKENTYERQKEIRGAQQKISKLERQISNLEKELKKIDFDLEVDYEITISQPNFFAFYQAKKKDLEKLMEKWEKLQLLLN